MAKSLELIWYLLLSCSLYSTLFHDFNLSLLVFLVTLSCLVGAVQPLAKSNKKKSKNIVIEQKP